MIWAQLLAYITGTVDQELLLRNEYLAAENRILKAELSPPTFCTFAREFSALTARGCFMGSLCPGRPFRPCPRATAWSGSPGRHLQDTRGPRGLRSQGTVSSRWSRDCVE